MPRYDYECKACGAHFEQQHGFNATPSPCPVCESTHLQKLITSAPTIARGMLTHAGDGRRASKEQLQAKWAEESPRLRKQLSEKLGEDTVNRMAPTLNMSYDNE